MKYTEKSKEIKKILTKIQERQLSWLGHIHRMSEKKLTTRVHI